MTRFLLLWYRYSVWRPEGLCIPILKLRSFLQLYCTLLILSATLLHPKEQEIFSFGSGNALRILIDVIYIINNFFISSRVSTKMNKLFYDHLRRFSVFTTCQKGRWENLSEPYSIGSKHPLCVTELVPFPLIFPVAFGIQSIRFIFHCTPKVS